MDQDDKRYVETIAIEPDGGLEGLPQEAPEEAVAPSPRRRFQLGFFHKVSIHLAVLIALGGTILTVIMATRFRRVLYEEEFRSAFTVYTAAANYIAAHYRSHKGSFIPDHLDYVFRERFMREEIGEHTQSTLISHRPAHLFIYSVDGDILYHFAEDENSPSPKTLAPDAMPRQLLEWFDQAGRMINIAGPVAPEDKVVAYLTISFPGTMDEKARALFLQMAGVMVLVIILAVGISFLFARRELAPIKALTEAAQQVHRGHLEQKVLVHRQDEIGELSLTFNEMVDSLSRRISLMRRMQESVVKMGRQLETTRLYATLISMFKSIAETRDCRLYVYNADEKQLDVWAEEGSVGLPVQEDDEISRLAFAERWAQFLDSAGRLTADPEHTVEMAIPLLSGAKRVGVIRMGRREASVAYEPETLTVLHTLAQFASVAIENANLYSQLGEQQRIEQEMLWAHNIQQSMLPRQRPSLEGYEIYGHSTPANEVGGDYFDYIRGVDEGWHIIIGDVSGKGVPAALIMTIVRSLMHTYLEFEASPRDVLTLVNRSLSADLAQDMFVTLSSIRLDPGSNHACVARAGHEPAMILRRSGEIEQIAPRGAALGLLDVARFQEIIEETEFVLEANETLVLYTDGVTESQNTDREDFGYDRLAEVLRGHASSSARDLHNAIIEAVKDYSRGMPQLDDITLVVLRRNGA